ncbi:MAG: lamin tail domain-containing protein [Chloroflexi bacterium]|nr:MAG: lamin tail domain-containing protein [Chloroflexota bacterium]
MVRSRRWLAIPILLTTAIVVVLMLPVAVDSELLDPICRVERVAAQDGDNACLPQEATLSAQQLDLIALESTNEAQRSQILALEGTLAILQLPGRSPVIITQQVVVTPTPDPDATQPVIIVTATPALATLERDAGFALPPTIATSQVEIVGISGLGDFNAEGIEIRNNGETINIGGWTLSDTNGNVYTFRDQLLFSGAVVTVFTRDGQDTPAALFWGRSVPVWEINDAAILTDSDGNVQATLRIEAAD